MFYGMQIFRKEVMKMQTISSFVYAVATFIGIIADTYVLLLVITGVLCVVNPGTPLNPFCAMISRSAIKMIARATKQQVERGRAITVALIALLFLRVVIVAVLRDLANLIN